MSAEIATFNARLAERQEVLSMRTYLYRINAAVFKQPIDEFVDDLLDLVTQDGCSIPHNRLVKYGVLTNQSTVADCTEILMSHGFEAGKDFGRIFSQSTGGQPAMVYLLHPDAFETCLMRAKHTRIYTDFYILLRKSIAGYGKYLLALENRKMAWLAAQNSELTTMLQDLDVKTDTILSEIKESRADIGTLRAEVGTLQAQNGNILTGLGSVKQQTDTIAARSATICTRTAEYR
jgi:hypothetical protein